MQLNDRGKAKLLWQVSEGYRLSFSLAIIAMAVGYVFMFGVPLLARLALDIISAPETVQLPSWFTPLIPGFEESNTASLLVIAGLTVFLTAVAGFFLYFRGRFVALASEGIVRQLRDRIYQHLEHLPSQFHDKADTGDLVQRCSSDMETVRVFLAGQVIEISRAILMLIIVLPILFSLDINMAWLSLVTMPILFVFAVIFFQRVKSLFLEVDESEARMTTVLQENLTGIRVVRAFARQTFENEKFAERNLEFRDQNTRLIKLLGVYYGFSDLICLGQICLLLVVGAQWVVQDSLTVGTLFAFLTYVGMIIWPIRHMGRVLTDSGKAIVSIGRLAEVLFEPIESQHEMEPSQRLQGDILIRDLHFGYEKNKPVLQGVNLSVKAGETLALLGAPGSGKSTIAQLLMRLYDYDEGVIELDSFELNDLKRKYVRAQISIVLQEPFLYSASIEDNLRVGKIDATQEQIEQAARDADIHESILNFPRGYQSMVGERGVTLSGGQRQRLALARALLKQPPILILDDALSAVDTDTEASILEALKQRRENQTTVIIAHRLSTVMHADQIIVLANGQVDQHGTHDSLRNVTGIYQQLCHIQGAIQEQLEADITHE